MGRKGLQALALKPFLLAEGYEKRILFDRFLLLGGTKVDGKSQQEYDKAVLIKWKTEG